MTRKEIMNKLLEGGKLLPVMTEFEAREVVNYVLDNYYPQAHVVQPDYTYNSKEFLEKKIEELHKEVAVLKKEQSQVFDEVTREFIKKIYPTLSDADKAEVEKLFPELAESEEERIRKEIIEGLRLMKDRGSFVFVPAHIDSAIAYLEKQKRNNEILENIDEYIDKHTCNAHDMSDSNPEKEYCRGVDDTLSNIAGILLGEIAPQMDNKAADEVLREERKDSKVVAFGTDAHADGMYGSIADIEQKSIEDVVKDITKNKEAAIKFLKSAGIMDDNDELAEMYRSEQKPAEWTELTWKDIVELEDIINNVHYDFSAGIGQESFGKEVLERFRNKKDGAEVDACEQNSGKLSEDEIQRHQDDLRSFKAFATLGLLSYFDKKQQVKKKEYDDEKPKINLVEQLRHLLNYRHLLILLLEAIDYSFARTDGTYDRSLSYPVIDKVNYIKKQLMILENEIH